MNLLERITNDLKVALKNKQMEQLTLLRGLKSAIKNAEIEARAALDDAGVVKVLQKAAKQRRESIVAFEKGGRKDLVAKETAELKVIEQYLPEQMSDDALREVVKKVVADEGAAGADAFGVVMGKVMAQVKGKTDGKKVQNIVKEILG